MKNLILYTLISIIANCGFAAGIAVIFMDRIIIEFHIEKSVVILGISIFIFSIIIIAGLFSEILGDSTLKYILKISVGILVGSLSINIFTVIKSMLNIFKYNDELFSCKFFTIYYKYSKKELLTFIDYYYEELSTITRKLTLKEKLKILGDSKTIREVREKVESYCDYEANSLWLKFSQLCENTITYCFDHPWALVSSCAVIAGLIAYSVLKCGQTTYNEQTVAMSVSDINSSILSLKKAIEIINTSLEKVVISVNMSSDTNKVIIKVLNDYFMLDFDRTLVLKNWFSDEEYIKVCNDIVKLQETVVWIVAPESVSQLSNNLPVNTTFTGEEHILGGTATRSRLLDEIKNEKDDK